MSEQVQTQTTSVAPTSVATSGALPLDAIAALRGLLDGLEASAQPQVIQEPATSPQIGTKLVSDLSVSQGIADVPQALVAQAESRLRSSRLWTMIGTVATLALQNSAGLNLSPAAQLGIAAVAAIYIAARSCKG